MYHHLFQRLKYFSISSLSWEILYVKLSYGVIRLDDNSEFDNSNLLISDFLGYNIYGKIIKSRKSSFYRPVFDFLQNIENMNMKIGLI